MAPILEPDVAPNCCLPADSSVLGRTALDVRTAAVLLAVGGGVVQGSGVVQDEWDPEVAGAMLVWVELITGATWHSEVPAGDTLSG